MVRSILGMLAGFVVTALIVGAGTVVAAMLLMPPPATGQLLQPTPAYLAINLIISAVAAVCGGSVADISARRPTLAPVWGFALVLLVLGIVSALGAGGAATGQPAWYPVVVTLLGPAGVFLGGWLAHGRRSAHM